MEQTLQLKYQRNYSIIINDSDVSLYYYFDYGERYKQINMDFQHSHRFHEIMIPLSPNATHIIEGIPYSLEEGDIVLLPPGVLHRTEYPAGAPSKRLIISFWYPKELFGMAEYYLPLLSIFNTQMPIYRFPEEIRRQVLGILDEIYTFSRSHDYLSHPEQRLVIHSLFVHFLYALKHNQSKNLYSNKPSGNSAAQKIYSIAYYIHSHYDDDLSLDSLAERFFLSSCYLSHQFKKVTGFTLINYIQQVRITRARDLLLSTNHSVSDIAQSCGFQSFSQFNRIFRQTYGQSPSAMRSNSTTLTSQQSNLELK
jgi:AraC-like DNA-binding protein